MLGVSTSGTQAGRGIAEILKTEKVLAGMLLRDGVISPDDVFPGFPLNRDLFETDLQYSMVQQYTDAGEPLPLIYGEGGIPNFYANTAEDVEKLHELITLADRRSFSSQSVISQIIEEEISGYNTGVLTVEQTAEKIQNRVQLYLKEQKQ